MSSLRIVYGAVYHHFARQKTIILALAMVFLLRPQQSVAAPDTLHRVESLVLSEKETQVRVFLGQCVAPKILVLSNPHRVVLDFIGITQAPKLQSIATGNVQRVRFAPFNVGTGRLVLHTDQDSRVDSTQLLPQANGQCIWQATLYAKSAVVNAPQSNLPAQNIPAPVKEALTVPPVVVPIAPPAPVPVMPEVAEPQISTCTIVLDAGHGGTDPGAMFAHLREKHITLYAAKELKRLINVLQPNAQIILTRDKDVYIPLGERPAVAQKQRAHMFISLHADMLPHDVTIRGASVYTLSETASDPIAESLALAENKADNVLALPADEAVAKILLDLVQRETQEKSRALAKKLTAALRTTNMVVNHTHREAGFRVLRGLAVPSVLIELGYLSNADDRAILNSKQQIGQLLRPIAQTLAQQCAAVGR